MDFTKLIGKTVKIKDVPQSLMELGLIEGQRIELSKHSFGLWVVKILSENGIESSTLALRDEELERLLVEEDNCVLTLS